MDLLSTFGRGLARLTVVSLSFVAACGIVRAPARLTGPLHRQHSSLADPGYQAAYDEKVYTPGERAEAAPRSATVVLTYGESLVSVPEALRRKIDDAEWLERNRRAATLIDGIAASIPAREASHAFVVKGRLLAGAQRPQPEILATLREALKRAPTWEDSSAIVALFANVKTRPQEAVEACVAAFEAARTEARPQGEKLDLLMACSWTILSSADPRSPEQVLTNVPEKLWAALDKREEDRIAEEQRQRQEAEEWRMGIPCLYNSQQGRYQRCHQLRDGVCLKWGSTCEY